MTTLQRQARDLRREADQLAALGMAMLAEADRREAEIIERATEMAIDSHKAS